MGKFMISTFLILGWAFYEMSGGADFVPQSREMAVAETEATQPEVTRAATADMVMISLPVTRSADRTPGSAEILPASVQVEAPEVTEAVAPAEAPAPQVELAAAPATEANVNAASSDAVFAVVEAVAADSATGTDLRLVAGSWVNMRSGPSTSFGVIDTLPEGTEAEVLEISDNGWARIRITTSGTEGWMAERLLTDG